MAHQPQTIGLFGLFGGKNLGNEATLKAALQLLGREFPEARVCCFCVVPDTVTRQYAIEAEPIVAPYWRTFFGKVVNRALLRWPSRIKNFLWAWRCVRKVDVLCVPGTGTFDDFGGGPGGYPTLVFGWALAAKLSRTPLLLISVGAGPIVHPLSRRLMGWAAGTARYRSYRDEVSKSFMTSIGLDTSADLVFPDLVFGLDLGCAPPDARSSSEPVTIGVGLMTYRGWRNDPVDGDMILSDYVAKIEDFVVWLVGRGYRVRLFGGEDSDEATVARVLADVGGRVGHVRDGVLAAASADTLETLAQVIADTDVVVATRYHNVICALICGRPVISIGYAAKHDAVMQDFGLADFCQHIDRLDGDMLQRQLQTLVSELPRREAVVAEQLARVHERLDRQREPLTRHLRAELDGSNRRDDGATARSGRSLAP